MQSPGIIIAFFAGVLSIASPCILPIMPSFLAYITGVSLTDSYKKMKKKDAVRKLFLNTLLFGIGFSLIFLFFGAVIGIIGETLLLNRSVFQVVGGVIITIFGLQLTGLINLKFLMKEKKFELSPKFRKMEYARSFLMGIFFAFGWAPCYGPILGAIFTLAATQANFWQAIMLFFFYSLGLLSTLFVFTAVIAHTSQKIKKFAEIARFSSIIAGALVMLLGILLMTNQLSTLVKWINLSYNINNFSLL
jgi:cytochrome c-type biogenesis protein